MNSWRAGAVGPKQNSVLCGNTLDVSGNNHHLVITYLDRSCKSQQSKRSSTFKFRRQQVLLEAEACAVDTVV